MTRRLDHLLNRDNLSSRRRTGVTLFELLVALALLGLFAAISVVSLPRATPTRDPAADRAQRITARLATARREAIRSGRAVTVYVADDAGDSKPRADIGHTVLVATAQPDGSLVLEAARSAAIAFDRLDGALRPEAGHALR